jgi:hypothetical protein
MDRRPLVCACFSVGVNVFFIYQPAGGNTIWARLSKGFCAVKNVFSQLVGQPDDGKLISKYERSITDGHVRVVRDKSFRFQRSRAAGHRAVQQVRTFDYGADAVAAA